MNINRQGELVRAVTTYDEYSVYKNHNIRGLATVNGGIIVQTDKEDVYNSRNNLILEYTSRKFKRNNKCLGDYVEAVNKRTEGYDTITYYTYDDKTKVKTAIMLKEDADGNLSAAVYKFNGKGSIKPYWNRNYWNLVGMSKENYDIVSYMHPIILKLRENV